MSLDTGMMRGERLDRKTNQETQYKCSNSIYESGFKQWLLKEKYGTNAGDILNTDWLLLNGQ